MTVPSEDKRENYNGNGVTLEFAIGFYFLINTDIKVYKLNTVTNVETLLAETTHYTLAGAGEPSGGTLTMLVAPTGDPLETITILRDVTGTQGHDYVELTKFPADSHERALDKLTMLHQQLVEEVGRTLKFKSSSTETAIELTEDLVADKAIIANATGTALIMGPDANEIESAQGYATAAETAAASLNIATPVASKEGALLLQNATDDGYDLLEAQGAVGQVLLSNGDNVKPSFGNTIPTINLTGGQIAFPATAVPSADPNTLDDYEEGAWTFGILFVNDEGDDPTYSRTAGFYTKIGNMCFLTGYMSMTNKGTSTGNAVIIGLPFTISNADGGDFVPSMRFSNITFTDFYMGYGAKNTTRITLEENDEGATETSINDTNFATNSTIRICGHYRIE